MSRHSLFVAEDIRWDELTIRRFTENAPYFLGASVCAIDARQVTLEVSDGATHADLEQRGDSLARSIAAELRDATESLLFEHAPASDATHEDPMRELLATRAVVRNGRGRYAYSGLMLTLLEGLDALVLAHSRELGAEPQIYPATVDAATLLRSGYLKAFPQHAYFVAPAAMTEGSLARVAAAGDVSAFDTAAKFGAHEQVLAPTVCYHCIESLRDVTLARQACYTALNPCHRHEVDGDHGLDRLHTFRMREIIAFGDPQFVGGVLDVTLEWTMTLLRRWDLAFRVSTASDPFFAGAQEGKLFYQAAFALKRELRMPLGFNGRWIAVASFNNHQQSFARAFSIRGPDPALHSGCTGWGYERLLYAMLASLGTDPARWPAVVRADLGC